MSPDRARVREAGIRIRSPLDAEEVLAEAMTCLGSLFVAEVIFARLVHGELLVPVGVWWPGMDRPRIAMPPQGSSWPPEGPMPAGATPVLSAVPVASVAGWYESGTASRECDLRIDAAQFPPADREALAVLDAPAVLRLPFGASPRLLGELIVLRVEAWSPEDTDNAEALAGDLGRGMEQARLYAQQRQLAEELRALHEARNHFLSTVSHELRTPLTSIAGYVEMLRDGDGGPVTAHQNRMLEIIDRNATRLRSLIEDLLTLSQIELGAFRTVKAPLDVREVVAGVTRAFQERASSDGLDIQLEVSPDPLMVNGDAPALERALSNLLSNAVKFTPAGGQVSVRTETSAGEAVLTVTDTGIGIPEGEQKALFTRWFRASNATASSVPGTGLGLSIVRAVVANHHGEMEISSRGGAGTTVVVRLPRHRKVAAADTAR